MEGLIREAENIFKENFKPITWFEKCVFLSWYCDKADCQFCFRSTLKNKISDARSAKRSIGSVLAEVYLCKALGWKLEFLTGGYGIYPFEELVEIVKKASEVYGEKIWINLGALQASELDLLKPYIKGVCASLETINRGIHKRVCPSKPLKPYIEMLSEARGLKKSIAIVLGLGESTQDIATLHNFIETHNIDRIDFYPLHPIKETPFKKGPDSEYYARWVAETRIRFPKIEIIIGTWVNRTAEVGLLLRAGANAITKFPAIRLFNSEQAKIIEEEAKNAGREFLGTLTDVKKLENIKTDDEKLKKYIENMQRPKAG